MKHQSIREAIQTLNSLNEKKIKNTKVLDEDLKGYFKNRYLNAFGKIPEQPELIRKKATADAYDKALKIARIDPTFKGRDIEDSEEAFKKNQGSYFDWLIRQVKKGYITFEQMMQEAQEFEDQLRNFEELKQKNKLPADKKDIMRLKSLDDLMDLVSSLGGDIKADVEEGTSFKSAIKNIRAALISICGFKDSDIPSEIQKTEDALILQGENSEWEMYLITSVWGAMLADTYGINWGAGATWCTGGQYGYVGEPRKGRELLLSATGFYNSYTGRGNGGQLIFFTRKDNSILRPKNKAQLTYYSDSERVESLFHSNDRPMGIDDEGKVTYSDRYSYGTSADDVLAVFLHEEHLTEVAEKSILANTSAVQTAKNISKVAETGIFEYNGGTISQLLRGAIKTIKFKLADGKEAEIDAKANPGALLCESIEELRIMYDLINGKDYIYNGDTINLHLAPLIKVIRFSKDYDATISISRPNEKGVREAQQIIAVKSRAFIKCTNLKEIYLPAKIKGIGSDAFSDECEDLVIYWGGQRLVIYDGDREFLRQHLKLDKSLSESLNDVELVKEELLLEATTEEIYNKYYSDIAKEDFDKVIAIDPTFNKEKDKMGEFGKWLLNLFKKGEDLSDEQEIKDQLQIFKSSKQKFNPEDRDINKYKTIKDFFDFMYTNEATGKSELQIKAEQHPGAKFICKSDNWEVYQPESWEASKWLRGDDAVWCTGRHDDNGFYRSYTRDGGKLFIFINLSKDKDSLNTKYQVSIRNNRVQEFRDARNGSANFAEFISDDGLFKALSQTEIALTPEYRAVKELKETNGVIRYSKLMAIKYTNSGEVSKLYELLQNKINVIIVNNGISYIKSNGLSQMKASKIILPDSIISIGERAFEGCINLKEIELPNKITTIPVECFLNCKSLEKVKFGTNVIEFRREAFEGTPSTIQLITPKHRIRVPAAESSWYANHLVREQEEVEESFELNETFEGTMPSWLSQLIKSRSGFGGYSSRYGSGYSSDAVGPIARVLRDAGVDLNKAKFKRLTRPRTKRELIDILNNEDIMPVFFIEPTDEFKQLAKQVYDSRNWYRNADEIRNIVYIPGLTNPTIGQYASDEFDKMSKQKLFTLISQGNAKCAYLDKKDKDNFIDSNKVSTRAARRSGTDVFNRDKERSSHYQTQYIVGLKQAIKDKYGEDALRWISDEMAFDSKQKLQRFMRSPMNKDIYTAGEWVKLEGPAKDYYEVVSSKPLLIHNDKSSGWGYKYDPSGYNLNAFRSDLAKRLNKYRQEHYTDTVEKMKNDIEGCKNIIKELFDGAMADVNSTQAMAEFNSVFKEFSQCVNGYNTFISNLDFILMQESDKEKEALLSQLFAEEVYSSKLRPTAKELKNNILNLQKQLKQFETTYIESLSK